MLRDMADSRFLKLYPSITNAWLLLSILIGLVILMMKEFVRRWSEFAQRYEETLNNNKIFRVECWEGIVGLGQNMIHLGNGLLPIALIK